MVWGGYGQKARAGFSPSSPTPRESTPLDRDVEFYLHAAEDVDAAVLLYVSQSRAHLPQAGWGAPESVVQMIERPWVRVMCSWQQPGAWGMMAQGATRRFNGWKYPSST